MAELARQHALHRTTVSEVLKRNGIPIRRTGPLREPELQTAAHLYTQGWSLAKLSKKYGFAPQTMRRKLMRDGVQMRRPWDHLLE